MSLAFAAAAALGDIAPAALAQDCTAASLLPYAKIYHRYYRKYVGVTRTVLGIAQRPRLRRRVVHLLSRHPRLLDRLLAWGLA
jgi:hypothetical protein